MRPSYSRIAWRDLPEAAPEPQPGHGLRGQRLDERAHRALHLGPGFRYGTGRVRFPAPARAGPPRWPRTPRPNFSRFASCTRPKRSLRRQRPPGSRNPPQGSTSARSWLPGHQHHLVGQARARRPVQELDARTRAVPRSVMSPVNSTSSASRSSGRRSRARKATLPPGRRVRPADAVAFGDVQVGQVGDAGPDSGGSSSQMGGRPPKRATRPWSVSIAATKASPPSRRHMKTTRPAQRMAARHQRKTRPQSM